MKVELVEWKTIFSDVNDLYFNNLVDNGELCLTFSDGKGAVYKIKFSSFFSYKRTDEDLSIEYWNIKTFSSWTFNVNYSPLFNSIRERLKELRDLDNCIHYGFASWDCLIEVFADKDPTIIKIEQQ